MPVIAGLAGARVDSLDDDALESLVGAHCGESVGEALKTGKVNWSGGPESVEQRAALVPRLPGDGVAVDGEHVERSGHHRRSGNVRAMRPHSR